MSWYQVASSTCITSGSVANCSYTMSTSTPIRVQDAGDVMFGLAWIIFLLTIQTIGIAWNIRKRRE